MINSVAFFDLAHTGFMNWALAIGFELGAAASLAAIIILDKTNKTMVWGLFLLLTAFQMMANSYHAFVNLDEFQGWIELFGLQDEELIFQKRVLSIVSGAVLPVVALGFIKSLTDYLKPDKKETSKVDEYFESRNQHMVDIVEKGAKARRKENFEVVDKERRAENFEKADKVIEDSIKQADEIESKSDVEESKAESVKATTPQSDDLEIHVDEESGTTFIKSKNKNNPL